MNDPIFPGFRRPTDDFRAVRDGRRSPLLWLDIDLSNARSALNNTQLTLPIAANFLYCDQRANTGFATAHFQDTNPLATPVTLFAGALWRVPFTKIAFENDAQPGASLRLIYGLDVDALPISAAGVTVLNAINVNDQIAANCLRQNIAPALAVGTTVTAMLNIIQNLRGAILRSIWNVTVAGAGGSITTAVIAAAVAPAGIGTSVNAVTLSFSTNNTATVQGSGSPVISRRIPATWGIWRVDICTVAIGNSNTDMSLEIL
jgi:hypothetical protein